MVEPSVSWMRDEGLIVVGDVGGHAEQLLAVEPRVHALDVVRDDALWAAEVVADHRPAWAGQC